MLQYFSKLTTTHSWKPSQCLIMQKYLVNFMVSYQKCWNKLNGWVLQIDPKTLLTRNQFLPPIDSYSGKKVFQWYIICGVSLRVKQKCLFLGIWNFVPRLTTVFSSWTAGLFVDLDKNISWMSLDSTVFLLFFFWTAEVVQLLSVAHSL